MHCTILYSAYLQERQGLGKGALSQQLRHLQGPALPPQGLSVRLSAIVRTGLGHHHTLRCHALHASGEGHVWLAHCSDDGEHGGASLVSAGGVAQLLRTWVQ